MDLGGVDGLVHITDFYGSELIIYEIVELFDEKLNVAIL